jgi:hypothetical protein
MKPQHNAEQSTVSVNKQELTGKKGFAAMRSTNGGFATIQTSAHADPANSTITVDVEAKVSAPVASNVNVGKATRIINPEEFGIDPGEANICEGCQ